LGHIYSCQPLHLNDVFDLSLTCAFGFLVLRKTTTSYSYTFSSYYFSIAFIVLTFSHKTKVSLSTKSFLTIFLYWSSYC